MFPLPTYKRRDSVPFLVRKD